ncbi:MAG: hypothetical protein ACLFVJ_06165 [Persicimonas sp.]
MRIEDIPLEDPCCESWNEMAGDEVRRHCEACDSDVVNLSALTPAETREVLSAATLPCVRFTHDGAGNVVFIHPQVRRQRRGLERLLAAAALVTPLLVGAASGGQTAVFSTAGNAAETVPHDAATTLTHKPLTDAEKLMVEWIGQDNFSMGVPAKQHQVSAPIPDGPVQTLAYIDEVGPAEPPRPEKLEYVGGMGRIYVSDPVELMWGG